MAMHYNPTIVRDGLVLHLDAANPKSYPGTGTTWYDLSGNGNNFTLYNSPLYDGKKLKFDGVNEYAECVNTTCGNFGTSGYVIEYCVNLASAPNLGSIIMKGGSVTSIGAGGPRWAHRCNVSFFAHDDNPGGSRSTAIEIASPAIDNFGFTSHHIMTMSRSGLNYTMNYYINNVLTGSKTGTLVGNGDISNSLATTILYTRGENVYTAGDVYFVRMYNRTLTIQEMQQNFNAFRGRYGI